VALAAAALMALGGCGHPGPPAGPPSGTALGHVFKTQLGGATIRTGVRLGYLFAYLKNVSDAPITIDSVRIPGPGIGMVVKPVEMKIAPLTAGPTSVGGGGYETDPPVSAFGSVCHVQALLPLAGYSIAPGDQVRIWVVFRALHKGNYSVPYHLIYYTQGGKEYRQVLQVGYYGSVSPNAPFIPPSPAERKCLSKTSLLNPGHG
jgi:hypothetical protein